MVDAMVNVSIVSICECVPFVGASGVEIDFFLEFVEVEGRDFESIQIVRKEPFELVFMKFYPDRRFFPLDYLYICPHQISPKIIPNVSDFCPQMYIFRSNFSKMCHSLPHDAKNSDLKTQNLQLNPPLPLGAPNCEKWPLRT